jgi:hypothetical protein
MRRRTKKFVILLLAGALPLAGPALAQGSIGGPAKQPPRIGGPAKPTSVVPSQKGAVAVPPTTQSTVKNTKK